MYDVVVVGSLNLDIVATATRLPGPGETVMGSAYHEYAGGKGLNQAIAAARAGATVALVGAVGDDEAGRTLLGEATSAGVDVSRVAILAGDDGQPTGRAVITVDDTAENSIVVVPGANGRVDTDGLDLPPCRVLLCQLEVPVDTVTAVLRSALAAAATRGTSVYTVLNPAPAQSLPDDLLGALRVIVPNEHEVDLLGGSAALLAAGVEHVVTTRGAAGVTHTSASREIRHDAFPVTAVDTTGAGDAFCGAMAARLAAGDDVDTAITFAAAAGALATTSHGAVPSLPHADAIRDLLVATR